MGDLVYAALVIVIIWAGIFFYLAGQSRRLKRLEEIVAGSVGTEPVAMGGMETMDTPGEEPGD